MATLSSYITEVQRLLHDANSVFWTTSELTDYINDARERVARDTGCLRTLQITATPISSTGVPATVWTSGATVTAGQFIFNNIFIYEVTVSGVLSILLHLIPLLDTLSRLLLHSQMALPPCNILALRKSSPMPLLPQARH
jgi:hypothetical protein